MGKKSKERRRAEEDLQPEEHVYLKKTKKRKNKHKRDQSSEEIYINESKDEHCTPEVTSKSACCAKKKKKDRHEEHGELNGTGVESTEDKMECIKSFQLETVKEKKRKKKKLDGDATPTSYEHDSKIEDENEEATSESDKGKKKRKKKKRTTEASPINDEQDSKIEDENEEATRKIKKVKKKKKKTKQKDIVIENKYFLDDRDSPKEKQNKNYHKIGASSTSVDESDYLDAGQNEAIKKKKKKRKREDDCSEKIDSPVEMQPVLVEPESHVKKVKKRKKNKHEDHVLVADNDSYEKKSEEDGGDYVNGKKSNEETTAIVGQWGTAQFDSSERQNKFFRLLGGMKNQGIGGVPGAMKQGKKGLFGGLAALVPKTGKNAMTNEQQTEWQTKMESQFDKALTYKGQKGGGLGFEKPPEEGKKFHINIHKSNSIKFDD